MAVLAEAGSFDLVLWGVLLACAALLLLAYQTRLPYPIMLVAGGAAIGFFSGAELEPPAGAGARAVPSPAALQRGVLLPT